METMGFAIALHSTFNERCTGNALSPNATLHRNRECNPVTFIGRTSVTKTMTFTWLCLSLPVPLSCIFQTWKANECKSPTVYVAESPMGDTLILNRFEMILRTRNPPSSTKLSRVQQSWRYVAETQSAEMSHFRERL